MVNSPTSAGRGHGGSQGIPGGGQAVEDAVHLSLDGGPDAAVEARGALARLGGDLDPPLLENMRLLITELITNAVRHAHARNVDVQVLVSAPAVRVEVADPEPGHVNAPSNGGKGAGGGWGLFLVEQVADRWGVAREERGKRVWFELERRN
jgi:anti-sigma regulatory factor (Ser/Thr protein kinase)